MEKERECTPATLSHLDLQNSDTHRSCSGVGHPHRHSPSVPLSDKTVRTINLVLPKEYVGKDSLNIKCWLEKQGYGITRSRLRDSCEGKQSAKLQSGYIQASSKEAAEGDSKEKGKQRKIAGFEHTSKLF